MAATCQLKEFSSYAETVPELMTSIGAAEILARQTRILIKPNLVNDMPPPVTTPVALVEAMVEYLQQVSQAEIMIAEGCGDPKRTTGELFALHGYETLARQKHITLIDLNEAPVVKLTMPQCTVFPEFMMPEILMKSLVISVPMLKAHSLAGVTLSLKNMIGCAPPRYYQQGGCWKKSSFHARMHEAIFELNRYRQPDLAILDATIGLADHHLRGNPCSPPVNKLVGGFDPVAVDAVGARLLGIDWRQIRHLVLADGVLGHAVAGSG